MTSDSVSRAITGSQCRVSSEPIRVHFTFSGGCPGAETGRERGRAGKRERKRERREGEIERVRERERERER